MDREKRRSEEHEAELDRRIALIREKNQQIEQRTKEIEEDRARNEDAIAKSSKTSSQTPPKATTPDRNGNGQWSREWDKGKTPAETWRENVPSMDLKGRLAGQQGGNQQNSGKEKRGNGGRGGQQKKDGGIKVPSRLEGRVTFPDGGQDKNGRKNGGRGGGNQKKHEDHEKKKVVTSTDGGDVSKGQRRRGGQKDGKEVKEQKNQKKEKPVVANEKDNKENEKKKKGKPRVRSESDNYAVKKVVHRLIDKICWMERVEKRKAMNEVLNEQEEKEPKSENEEEEEEVPVEDVTASETVPEAVPEESEKKLETETTPEPADSASEPKEDSNQNVISLVREKVVTMTTSQVL